MGAQPHANFFQLIGARFDQLVLMLLVYRGSSLRRHYTPRLHLSDYTGSSLIIRLLEKGFTVHAAIQNHGDEEIEVRAAHNVLEACGQIDTIEKVVFTSSAAAIIWGFDDKKSSSNLDEKHWSDINFCRKYKLWYAFSKTLAEKTAWALAMDRGINMVSINSGLLMDPNLNIKNPYLKGAKEMYENGVFVSVDVDFLVDAHICVYEDVSSYGRYLCFNHIINTIDDAINLANKLSPLPSSPPSFEKDTEIIQQRISNKKLNKIMIDFRRSSEKDLLENQED